MHGRGYFDVPDCRRTNRRTATAMLCDSHRLALFLLPDLGLLKREMPRANQATVALTLFSLSLAQSRV